MANVKITIPGPLMDGHRVTFKAPCACTGIDKLDVRYIDDDAQKSKLFTLKDSHGNDLTGIGNLFDEGAYVHVILSVTNNAAYIQNGDTNGYLEGKFAGMVKSLSDLGVTASATELNYMDGVTSNVQNQLNGKAASSHGTHVSYSSTAPVMDGTASVGSASTVARSDHKHPSDTSRIPTANIANSFGTTASGYVLDARLGSTIAQALKAPQKVRYTATSNTSVGNCTGSSQSFTISGAPKGHYIVLGCGATSGGSWEVYDAELNSNTRPTKCTCKVNAWSDGGSFKMYVDVLYFGTLG